MIAGAADELRVGDPRDPATHVGPVIDAEAKNNLDRLDREHGRASSACGSAGMPSRTLPKAMAPMCPQAIVMLDRAGDFSRKCSAPFFTSCAGVPMQFDPLLDEIAASGYGLTLGIHSRIDAENRTIVARLAIGNVYVNRNMIGAVVGTQPFGGAGLSGTGPKAGGPSYLRRFANEQVVSINTAATGGNASLLAASEE